jgi:hypothetical protein
MTLPAIPDVPLQHGAHDSRDEGVCVMEMVAWMAGEPHSDHPECTSPVVAAFLRSWNDGLPDDAMRDRLLRPLLPVVLDTRTTAADETTRAWMATDWLVRVHAPAWMDLVPSLRERAAELRALPALTSAEIAVAVQATMEHARVDANAARAAAGDAAWAAAGDAAGDAARDAARDAAGAAAGDAAGDAAGAAAGDAAWAAAGDAARDAARDAAWAAARDAARDAAWDAAWAAARAAAGDAAWAAAGDAARDAARAAAGAAAWAAAGAAAWAAAGDAAWAAAGDAARAAAGAAAWAAAGDALAPTAETLQASAQDLVRRMCAVGRTGDDK